MLDARTSVLLANQNHKVENNDACDKKDCPAMLNQIWVRQILNQQNNFDRAYAKKHSLEIALTPKILSTKLVDRSNLFNRVA